MAEGSVHEERSVTDAHLHRAEPKDGLQPHVCELGRGSMSTLMGAAVTLDQEAAKALVAAARHGLTDLVEVCCACDSALAGQVLRSGGSTERYSHWNGYDLTTSMKGMVEIQKNTTIAGSGLWPCPSCGEVVLHAFPRASTPGGFRCGHVLLEAPLEPRGSVRFRLGHVLLEAPPRGSVQRSLRVSRGA